MTTELLERISRAMRPGPICRDCGDADGRCPTTGELCDPHEQADELMRLLRESLAASAGSGFLDWLEAECVDLRCESVPTGGGDADVVWVVYSHHIAKPQLRQVGSGDTPADAIRDAMEESGYTQNAEVSHRDRERQPATDQPSKQP